jgi:hypothetical protein
MVVAAQPGAEASIEPELDLIKAALLYGDKVTLLSAATTMFLGVEGLARFSLLDQIKLLRKLAPYLADPSEAASLAEGMDTMEAALRATGPGSAAIRAQLTQALKPTQETLSDELAAIARQGKVDELARARAEGLLRIENLDPGGTADMIASCVISAKLVEKGEPNDPGHTDRMVETFLGKLSDHLSSGREYLIFDEPIASLTKSAIEVGIFEPAKGPAGRSAQAMTASGLMGYLPTFPDASVDEVLDIRTELAPALTQFRSTMVTLSKDFNTPAWESGFADEVHDAWVESVHPAVEAIDTSVRDNKSLLGKAAGLMGTLKATAPGLTIAGAGVAGHDPPAAVAGAAVTAAGGLLQALRDHKATATSIKMQPFYFLYALNRALPED